MHFARNLEIRAIISFRENFSAARWYFWCTKLFARNLARGKFYVAFRSGKIFCAQFRTPRCHKFVREDLRRATTFVFPCFWGMEKKFARRNFWFCTRWTFWSVRTSLRNSSRRLMLGVTESYLFSQFRGTKFSANFQRASEAQYNNGGASQRRNTTMGARLKGAIQQRGRASKAQYNNEGAPQRRNTTTGARLKGAIQQRRRASEAQCNNEGAPQRGNATMKGAL